MGHDQLYRGRLSWLAVRPSGLYGEKHEGLQSGVVNYANSVTGVEIGFLNYTDDVDAGVQIGIINIIRSNKTWFSDFPNSLAPMMIFLNW